MNIILCVVAASILVNVAKSGKNAEVKAEDIKKFLEGLKTRLEFIEQNLNGQPQEQLASLQNDLMTTETDIAKAIENVKILEQQRKAEEASSAHKEGLAGSDPKRELRTIKDKLAGVIRTLDLLKKQANSKSDRFNGFIDTTINFARDYIKALKVALAAEDKNMDIEGMRNKARDLLIRMDQIGRYIPEKAKKLQQSVLTTAEEIKNVKSETTSELKTIKDKLPGVIQTLGLLKKEANSKNDRFDSFIDTAIKSARDYSKALNAALEAEDKNMDIKVMGKTALTLSIRMNQIGLRIPEYYQIGHADVPEKAKQLQQSVLTIGEEIKNIIQNPNV